MSKGKAQKIAETLASKNKELSLQKEIKAFTETAAYELKYKPLLNAQSSKANSIMSQEQAPGEALKYAQGMHLGIMPVINMFAHVDKHIARLEKEINELREEAEKL